MEKQAVLRTVKRGKQKGEVYFRFKAPNGQDIGGSTPETYVDKSSAIDTLESNFGDFKIVDETDTIQHVELIED